MKKEKIAMRKKAMEAEFDTLQLKAQVTEFCTKNAEELKLRQRTCERNYRKKMEVRLEKKRVSFINRTTVLTETETRHIRAKCERNHGPTELKI